MRTRNGWAARLLSLALCAALTGCGGGRPAAESSPSPTADVRPSPSPSPAAEDSVVTVALGDEPVSTDPAAASGADEMALLCHLFEGLMKWSGSGRELSDGVEAAQAVPGMAERYEKTAGADGSVTYTFHLRAARWSDGKAVTAHDFVYAWQRLLDPSGGAVYADLLDSVAGADALRAGQAQATDLGVRAVDDVTFAVTLTQDIPWFLELCALPFTAPLRQDKIEEGGSQWTYSPETFVTNGPYRLLTWENDSLTLEKNPQYYDGAAGPDSIVFTFRGDDAADLAAYREGSLDFLQGVSPQEGEPRWAPYPASCYLMFQTERAPFDDPLVRQAFSLAIDRGALTREQAPGRTPAGGLVSAGVYGADGAAGADFRTHAGDCLDPSDQAYSGNRDMAKALLSQAGYPEGAGFPEVTYLCPAGQQALGEALARMWQEALGVSVSVETVDWGGFLNRCHQGEFFIARGRWVADYNDPAAFLELWRSGAQGNDARYGQEQYDELLDRADRAESPSARMELLAQAEALLVGRDCALAPLYYETRAYLVGDGLTGVCYIPLGYFLFTRSTKG